MDYIAYKKILQKHYPQCYQFVIKNNPSIPFSEQNVLLSKKHLLQMQQVVKSFYQLKNSALYHQNITLKSPALALQIKNQDSVLMAYDFHLQDDQVKLIEINTNASAFLLVNSLYQFNNWEYKNSLLKLKNSFKNEWNIFKPNKKPAKIVLIDEDPFNQKMLIEFFMYKDFFKSMGWDLEILDPKHLKIDSKNYLYNLENQKVDFIYNRCTDFYLKKYPQIATAYLNNTCLINPQPRDYYLLADKKRMQDWSCKNFFELEAIKKHLLQVKLLTQDTKEELWKDRKKYFFKMSEGYSGKMAYRGASLSRKKREELLTQEAVAQEYVPATKITDSHNQEWKVDFRAFVYKDNIQQLCARVYQGQLTNFKTVGSGFAKIRVL